MKRRLLNYGTPLCVAFFGSFLFNGINIEALALGVDAVLRTGYGIFVCFLNHKMEA